MCHMSFVECCMSPVTCNLSQMPKATATDPILQSSLVQDPKTQEKPKPKKVEII